MSRRGGGRQSAPNRTQPSPASSHQPTSTDASGMGRGRGSRVPASSPATAPLPSFAPATAPLTSFAPAHAPSSLSAPAPATASQYPAESVVSSSSSAPPSSVSVSTEALTSDVEKKLMLQPSAPSSSKAIRFPDRPGFGRLGRKIQVRANHFQVQVADRDLHHYDVSILVYNFFFLHFKFKWLDYCLLFNMK